MQIPQLTQQNATNFKASLSIKTHGKSLPKTLLEKAELEAKKIGTNDDSFTFTIGSTTFWKKKEGVKQGYKLFSQINLKNIKESFSQIIFQKTENNKISQETQIEDIISIIKKYKK